MVAPWIFDVLETGIFSEKNQISAGQLSAHIWSELHASTHIHIWIGHTHIWIYMDKTIWENALYVG